MGYLEPIRTQQNLPTILGKGQADKLQTASGAGKKSDSPEELKALSQQFESVLVNQLLTVMRTTVPKSDLLGGHATDMFTSMLDQELADKISKTDGMGIGDMLFKQLTALKEQVPADAIGEAKDKDIPK